MSCSPFEKGDIDPWTLDLKHDGRAAVGWIIYIN
jgi:hypothetical protein